MLSYLQQKGGGCMEDILSLLLVTVAADVISYYIRKWLDSDK